MQTIYCVWASEGSYDDYVRFIVKAFFNKKDAEYFKENYNIRLKINEKQALKCEKCLETLYDEINNPELLSLLIDRIQCSDIDMSIDEENIPCCKNKIDYYDVRDLGEATVEELKVN